MSGLSRLALSLAAGLSASVASADSALLIGNSRYDHGSSIRSGVEVVAAASALDEAGFDVIHGRNLRTERIREGMSQFYAEAESERIVIALSGHFATSDDGEVWFLGTEARAPDRANIGASAVALSTVLALAAEAPGRAIVILGSDDRRMELGRGLTRGIEPPDVPQGVSLVIGDARAAARFLWGPLLEPGRSIASAVATNDDLTAVGFLPDMLPFLDPPTEGAPPASDPNEVALWTAAEELDNAGAYRAYLREYPFGPNAAEARARLSELENDPVRLAEAAEDALNLTRNDRRAVQRGLTVLGFDTRGIDGIFGPGSRSAIRGWQQSRGLTVTGFLDAQARDRLLNEAAARQAEIDAAEAAERAERERQDRAYWRAIGRGQDEAGLRSYLDRYPDGVFADVARDRLEAIEAEAEAEAARLDDQDWDFARSRDTVVAYDDYLDTWPEGRHADEAERRIAELTGQPVPPAENAEAAAREAALNLPQVTRLLLEQRLRRMGLNPGQPDGVFDDQTRIAIAEFQRSSGLQPTGYVDRDTITRIIASALGR